MRREIIGVVLVVVAFWGTYLGGWAVDDLEACQPASPWSPQGVSAETPECLAVRDEGAEFGTIENFCEEAVTVELLECSGAECEMEPREVAAGEELFVRPETIGIDDSELGDETTVDVTLAWMRGEQDEGTIEAWASYRDTSGACDGNVAGGGCGDCASEGSSSEGPAGGFLLASLLVGAVWVARLRRRR